MAQIIYSAHFCDSFTATGLVAKNPSVLHAVILDGGTGSTGATLVLNDSEDGSGDDRVKLRAPQYGQSQIVFVRPVKFFSGIYATLTSTAGSYTVSWD